MAIGYISHALVFFEKLIHEVYIIIILLYIIIIIFIVVLINIIIIIIEIFSFID